MYGYTWMREATPGLLHILNIVEKRQRTQKLRIY